MIFVVGKYSIFVPAKARVYNVNVFERVPANVYFTNLKFVLNISPKSERATMLLDVLATIDAYLLYLHSRGVKPNKEVVNSFVIEPITEDQYNEFMLTVPEKCEKLALYKVEHSEKIVEAYTFHKPVVTVYDCDRSCLTILTRK